MEKSELNKQRLVVVKVILAMAVFLLGVPALMYLVISFYTNRGVMVDSYLMLQEHTQDISNFYQKNNRCPTNSDLMIDLSDEPFIGQIDLVSDTENTCYIVATIKEFTKSVSGKKLVLSKQFTANTSGNDHWQCSSNANNWYLSRDCNTLLPDRFTAE